MTNFDHLDADCRRSMASDIWETRAPKDFDYIIPLTESERTRISRDIADLETLLPLVHRILGALFDGDDGHRWTSAMRTLEEYLVADAIHQKCGELRAQRLRAPY
jgi:hypothetical protein